MKKNQHLPLLLALLLALLTPGCGSKGRVSPPADRVTGNITQQPYTVNGRTYYPLPSSVGFVQRGRASWYGKAFHGKPTACGEPYNMYSMTAAHKTLPMHTYVRVTNLGNGRQAVVRINDRGPFAKQRIIDLSYAAARKVGMIASGTAQVKIQALGEVRTGRGEPARFVRLPDIQNGRFFVQVGAFQDAHNAQNLRRKLTSHYNNVVVSRQISGKDTLYRVQIFAANNYSEAKAVEARIEKSGFPGAFLVAR